MRRHTVAPEPTPSQEAREALSPRSLFGAGEKGVWYDPSDLSTMFKDVAGTQPATLAGDPVARINDKSPNGFHALQAAGTQRPTLQFSSGRAYLLGDGVDDWLRATAVAITLPFDRISGLRTDVWVNGARLFGGGGGAYAGELFQGVGTPTIEQYDGAVGPAVNLTLATEFVVTERHAGAGSRIALNNAAYATGNGGATDPGGITLMASGDATGTSPGALRIYGVVQIGRALTADEIIGIRSYMAQKVGLVL